MRIEAGRDFCAVHTIKIHSCIAANEHRIVGVVDNCAFNLCIDIACESNAAQKFSVRLFEEGVFALPIVYPMVARGKARIRVMMNAALRKDDLNGAITAFEKVGKELNII